MWVTRRLPIVVIATVLLVTAGAGAGRAIDPGPMADALLQTPTTTSPSVAPPMSPAVEVTGTGYGAREPDVAYNSTFDEYLVVWKGSNKIWGRRVSSRGQPLGTEFHIATGPAAGVGGPRVAYDSSRNRYLVVWGQAVGLEYHMHGRIVPWNGPTSGLAAFAIDTTRPAGTSHYAVAYALAQDEFLVVWPAKPSPTAPLAITARRVEADGTGFPAGPFWVTSHASDYRQNPDVAYNLHRNEYLVTCDDYPKVNENIFGVRLAGNGAVLGGGEFGITHWADDETFPAVAACHTEDQYLVTWHSFQIIPNTDGIYARLVAGDGSPGSVQQVAHYTSPEWHRPTDVACGVTGSLVEGPHYLTVWDKNPDYAGSNHAREVHPDGRMGDPVEVTGYGRPAVVAGGAINYLAAWETYGSDGDGYTDIYARIVGNTVPVALFTVSPLEGDSTTLFQFDASPSSDATDHASRLQVRWDWDNNGVYDTPWSHTRTASHQFPVEPWVSMEVKIVQLEVTDGRGASDTTTGQVTVRNAPPSAAFAITPTTGDTNTSFLFDASSSSDPEGGALEVRWDWEDDGTYDTNWSAASTARHTFPAAGTYTVRLQVRDNWEQADTTTHQVTVQPGSANTPPQASFTVNPSNGDTSTLFTFDASGSTDAEDGTPPEVRWDWNNDGVFEINWGTAKTIQHTFTTVGTYTVRLEVRDSGGLTDATTRQVPVGQPQVQHRAYLPLAVRSVP